MGVVQSLLLGRGGPVKEKCVHTHFETSKWHKTTNNLFVVQWFVCMLTHGNKLGEAGLPVLPREIGLFAFFECLSMQLICAGGCVGVFASMHLYVRKSRVGKQIYNSRSDTF